MNDTQNLLAFVYKNASMGTQTLPQIAEKTDGDFRTAVENRLARYEDIKKSAGKLLTDEGSPDPEKAGLNGFEKASANAMLKMNLSIDSSIPRVADMLIKGSSMGIRDISEQIEKYPGADRRAVSLARDLLELEEAGLDEMKKYLLAQPDAR